MSNTDTSRFLLIMPRSEEFNNLRQLITSSLQEVGLKPIVWDEAVVQRDTRGISIQKAVELADIIIVDITGNDPNVMFGSGFAIGAAKPVLPIVQRTVKRVPSYLSGRLYLVYDPSEPTQLSDKIKAWVLRHLGSRREVEK